MKQIFEHCYVEIMDKREKIREILTVHNLDPQETMFVGDMVHDLETARHVRKPCFTAGDSGAMGFS